MGLAHLLEALERDANGEIGRLRADARAAADRITADSAAALEQRRRTVFDEHERQHRQEVEQALTVARRDARLGVLAARQRLLDRVFDAARAELPDAVSRSIYRASLPAALVSALAAVGDDPVVVRCAPVLAPDLEGLRPSERVSVVADAAAGSGFRVTTTDGTIEVDDTLEDRLERLRPLLSRRVLEQLVESS